jgi:hypothetical protein
MYKGTLINDLLATVERAEERVQQRRKDEEAELRHIFELQSPQTQRERIYAGAA